jgi:hypothetical protein
MYDVAHSAHAYMWMCAFSKYVAQGLLQVELSLLTKL